MPGMALKSVLGVGCLVSFSAAKPATLARVCVCPSSKNTALLHLEHNQGTLTNKMSPKPR